MMDRRRAMQALGLAAAGAALPAAIGGAALGATRTAAPVRKAPRLREGDTVGLVAPATYSDDPFKLELVEEAIAAMGLKPKRGAHVLDRYGYLAGTDEDRAADINAMYADPEVKAVFAVRGGWGCARVLPHLDWDVISAHPKLLVGYSDITALHMAFAARAGFATIHGPIGASAWTKMSWESFRAVAFEGATPTWRNPPGDEDRLVQKEGRTTAFRRGVARGRLLGGNLTVLTALVGTPYLPDFKGAILFIEDVDEAEYRIDRMLTQLGLAGILGQLSGVVFGQCTDCTAKDGSSAGGFTLSQVLDQHLTPLGVPAFQGLEFGHVDDQFSLPEGVMAEIDATAGTVKLLEPAVA
ncbi:LD-carboxypeptidase [Phenylobacterium sp.]|uniref:S66 peptidase family protein n=1 Tax=Phenylobacterium sp. TaxID=1871053 RepID=UPI0035B0B720